jgi:membrane glycosyltransferase
MTERVVLHEQSAPGMPPAQPLAMHDQDLRTAPPAVREPTPRPVKVARFVAFGGAAVLGAAGTYEMVEVVAIGDTTLLEALMTALFAVTFSWIAFTATSAFSGLLAGESRPRVSGARLAHLSSRTALIMPIFHEDPVRTTAALQIMARGLAACGQAHAFEVVVLSDSTNADAWVAETTAIDDLKQALHGTMPVWYRRRLRNVGKKAGNLREFLERWGGRYDHFVVLDGDSLLAPSTLVAMAAAMEAEPQLGLLQTVPVLAGGRTLFARLQQFAGRIYGSVIARGLAAWQGSDGNYWGHNAVIRTAAFASCCGLPELRGKQPLGGSILSHDFVEAALMRRAGWRVELDPDLDGSWEESPPSLLAAAARDRRWAQGNLQHLKVVAARGLTWPSRAHLAIGIMSYCASPMWLLLIAFGFALSLQAHFVRPEYFTDTVQLFPTWPVFDSERMLRLLLLTLLVLLLPKAMGLMRALASAQLRRSCGGVGLIGSAIVELILSALYAPIMMAIQSQQIYEILTGRDAGWSARPRDDGAARWTEAWRRHAWHTALGLATAVAAWLLSPAILAWFFPTLAGLLIAIPLSRASGSARIGGLLRGVGLLLTPEETNPHPLLREHEALVAGRVNLSTDGVRALATNAAVRAAHFRWAGPGPRRRGAPDTGYLTAEAKIADAASLDEALAWLDAGERVVVAAHPALAQRLAQLPSTNLAQQAASCSEQGPQVRAHDVLRLAPPNCYRRGFGGSSTTSRVRRHATGRYQQSPDVIALPLADRYDPGE